MYMRYRWGMAVGHTYTRDGATTSDEIGIDQEWPYTPHQNCNPVLTQNTGADEEVTRSSAIQDTISTDDADEDSNSDSERSSHGDLESDRGDYHSDPGSISAEEEFEQYEMYNNSDEDSR